MGLRIGPGPIFPIEARAIAGRRRFYIMRSALVAAWVLPIAIAGAILLVLMARERVEFIPLEAFYEVGRSAYLVLAASQITAALLIPPAIAADALGRDRIKGFLGYLFLTDLSAPEIVLGSFLARLFPTLALLAAPIPIVMLAVLWFGTDPGAVWMLAVVSLGLALLGLSLATAISLWTKRAYETLLGVYAIWLAWLFLPWFFNYPAGWSFRINPYAIAFGPYFRFGTPVAPADGLAFLGYAAIASLAALVVASAFLRRVALRERARHIPKPRNAFGWWRAIRRRIAAFGPPLDGNPALWLECRHGPRSGWLTAYWALFAFGTVASTLLGLTSFWNGQVGHPDLIAVSGFGAGFGLLAVTVKSASAWSAERGSGQGGFDTLLVTPLSAGQLIRAKWWACYRPVFWVAACPAFAAIVLAINAPSLLTVPVNLLSPPPILPLRPIDRIAVAGVVIGQILLFGAATVSLGLWLATRLRRPMYAVIAAVVIYVLITIGWPIAAEAFLMHRIGDRDFYEGLATISPLSGPIALQASLYSPWYGTPRGIIPYAIGCLALAATFATALTWLMIRTFDRRMGRMPGRSGPLSSKSNQMST